MRDRSTVVTVSVLWALKASRLAFPIFEWPQRCRRDNVAACDQTAAYPNNKHQMYVC